MDHATREDELLFRLAAEALHEAGQGGGPQPVRSVSRYRGLMRTAVVPRNVPVLTGLPDELLERLARQTNDVRVHAAAWRIRQGASADSTFIVRSGRLEVIEEGPRRR